MSERRKTVAIAVGALAIAAVATFVVLRISGGTSYDGANEIIARLRAEGFDVADTDIPPPPVEPPGTTYVVLRGRDYEGSGWIAVSDESVEAVKAEFDGPQVVVVEGGGWAVAVADDSLEKERTEGLAAAVAEALGGEVPSP